jgi:uncharacterized protein YndB with AHSA1/START domain
VIRLVLRLALLGLVAAAVVDRVLARHAAGRPPEPIRSLIVVDAPVERVWSELADIEGQPRWMREMKAVRVVTPPPVGVGTVGEADVRIFGVGVTDPVTITEWEPPHRFAIAHEGLFTGAGVIELTPGADGTTTIVRWAETLIPPILPWLGGLAQRPVLGQIFQGDLERFRDLVEA